MSRRRALVVAAAGAAAVWGPPPQVWAFGEEGAFHARILKLGEGADLIEAQRAAGRWAWELVRRTSAPGQLNAELVDPASERLLSEPFAVWAGQGAVEPLSTRQVRRLREYLRMGGILVVDDRDPQSGTFRREAMEQMARVLPESAPVRLEPKHVLFKTFYLLPGPSGRVEGPPYLEAIVRGKNAQVLFLSHDLLGALARSPDGGNWAHPAHPGGNQQRELAIRMAVNIAMYALCSDYKDDQVHAPFLMRRRQKKR